MWNWRNYLLVLGLFFLSDKTFAMVVRIKWNNVHGLLSMVLAHIQAQWLWAASLCIHLQYHHKCHVSECSPKLLVIPLSLDLDNVKTKFRGNLAFVFRYADCNLALLDDSDIPGKSRLVFESRIPRVRPHCTSAVTVLLNHSIRIYCGLSVGQGQLTKCT